MSCKFNVNFLTVRDPSKKTRTIPCEIRTNLTGGVRYFELVCTSMCGVMRYKRFIVGQTTDIQIMQQIQNFLHFVRG